VIKKVVIFIGTRFITNGKNYRKILTNGRKKKGRKRGETIHIYPIFILQDIEKRNMKLQ